MRTAARGPTRLSESDFRLAYWNIAQILAHQTNNRCNLRPDNLLGTGTRSGPDAAKAGLLLELSDGGPQPL
jgi:fumarylacetoacetase